MVFEYPERTSRINHLDKVDLALNSVFDFQNVPIIITGPPNSLSDQLQQRKSLSSLDILQDFSVFLLKPREFL